VALEGRAAGGRRGPAIFFGGMRGLGPSSGGIGGNEKRGRKLPYVLRASRKTCQRASEWPGALNRLSNNVEDVEVTIDAAVWEGEDEEE
jgi:hypothetical protein